ncbi:MAG: hypothetical protein QOG05_5831, partial [Streptosporangiaceae bacterium]|nr:hypothetical protein [Streptosporangiaceae bacterium]
RPALVVVEPVKDIRRFEHEDECNGRARPGRGPTPGEIRPNLPPCAPRSPLAPAARPQTGMTSVWMILSAKVWRFASQSGNRKPM